MRKLFNSIMVLALLLASSCKELSEVAVYNFDQFSFYETSITYTGGSMTVGAPVLSGEKYITIPYENYEQLAFDLTVVNEDMPEGLSLEPNYHIGKYDGVGELKINLVGTPTVVGSYYIAFELKCGDNSWFFRVDDISVVDIIEPLALRNVNFKAPVLDDPNHYNKTYQLSFEYKDAEVGTTLDLYQVLGYLTVNETLLADGISYSLEPGEAWKSAVWEMPDYMLDYSVDGWTTDLPAKGDLSLRFKYNGVLIGTCDENGDGQYEYDTDTDTYPGFEFNDLTITNRYWGGVKYELIELPETGRTWMDRNLGATSISQNVVTMNGNVISDTYVPNFDAYGDYYILTEKTGVAIQRDGNCPLFQDGLVTGVYNVGQTYTAITGHADGWNVPTTEIVQSTGNYGYMVDPSQYKNQPYFKTDGEYWDDDDTWNNSSVANIVVSDLDTYLNDTEDGGIYNPCPPGYRLPSIEEVYAMITEVCGSLPTSANSYAIPNLVSRMNFALTGVTWGAITEGTHSTSANYQYVCGMPYRYFGPTTSDSVFETAFYTLNIPSESYIFIRTCDLSNDTYNLLPVKIAYNGIVSQPNGTSTTYRYDRYAGSGMPSRCIKHQ